MTIQTTETSNMKVRNRVLSGALALSMFMASPSEAAYPVNVEPVENTAQWVIKAIKRVNEPVSTDEWLVPVEMDTMRFDAPIVAADAVQIRLGFNPLRFLGILFEIICFIFQLFAS